MKKIGQFFFTFIPIIAALILMFLVQIYCIGFALLTVSIYSLNFTSSFRQLTTVLQNLLADTTFSATLMMNYSLFAAAVFGIWYYCCYGGARRLRFSGAFHPVSFAGILLLVPGAYFVTSYLVTIISLAFPSWLETYEKLLENSGMSGTLSVPLIVYGTLVGPVAEELIFRGVTLEQARKALPFWAANIFQAFLFGVYHMNLLQGTYAFFLGLLLGYLCKRGKIHSSILLHILYNAWGLLIASHITVGSTPADAMIFFLLTIVLFTGGIFCFTFGTNRLAENDT